MAVLFADACYAYERTPHKRKQNEGKLRSSREANFLPWLPSPTTARREGIFAIIKQKRDRGKLWNLTVISTSVLLIM